MKILLSLGFVIQIVAGTINSAHATDWPKSDVPPDPAVTFGALPNGMRYAIMHNNSPAGIVSVRLRIAAGALQETDIQRGLAHFLEHMAFRGSSHVADGEIQKTLDRLGLQFGADTNASTGQDQTIYQFDLPKSDDAAVDTALTFTREIAGNLSLDPAAAKTEAAVVLSELRLRDVPAFRMLQAQLAFALQDPHASALPNGDPAVIAKASIVSLRDYYQSYYRPDRATLVVVGDIDPAKVQAKIIMRFSDWSPPGTTGKDPAVAIPMARGLEAKAFTAPGAPPAISFWWLAPPHSKPSSALQEKSDLIDLVGLQILNRRFQEAAAGAARPFTSAAASRAQFLQRAEVVSMTISYESDHWHHSLEEAEKIRLSTLRSGVTQAEVDRAKSEMTAAFQAANAGSDTRLSPVIATAILREVAENDVFTSPARNLATLDQDLKGLTADDVTRALRKIFQGSGPLVFVSGPNPIDSGEAAVKAAFQDVERSFSAAKPTSIVRDTNTWPYADFGTGGMVSEMQQISDLGVTFVRFANGVRLTLRSSKAQSNQVLISVKVGGGRLEMSKDRLTAAWAANGGAVIVGGLADMSYTQMQHVLTPKIYKVAFSVGDDGFLFSGETTPGDIDTQLQVFAAYVKAPGFRPEGFEQVRGVMSEQLPQIATNPMTILQLEAPQALHDGDKRWGIPSKDEVKNTKVEDLRALLAPAFARGPIDVTIVGDVATEKAIRAVAATFGALPARDQIRPSITAQNIAHFPVAKSIKLSHTGQAGQDIASVAWATPGRFPDIQDDATQQILSAIMQQRLFDNMRSLGGAYVTQAGGTSSKVFNYGYLQALAQLPPDKFQQFYDSVDAIVADMQMGKITQDDLDRAKSPSLQSLKKLQQNNAYWLSVLDGTQEDQTKLDLARKYEVMLQQVTIADVAAISRKYLTQTHATKLTIEN